MQLTVFVYYSTRCSRGLFVIGKKAVIICLEMPTNSNVL